MVIEFGDCICLIACQLTIKHAVFPHFGNTGKKSPLEQPVCGDVIVQSCDVECSIDNMCCCLWKL